MSVTLAVHGVKIAGLVIMRSNDYPVVGFGLTEEEAAEDLKRSIELYEKHMEIVINKAINKAFDEVLKDDRQ